MPTDEKFAKPGQQIMKVLRDQKLLTPEEFDEEIEWTWFYLWHHEGRRARHGASMMAPDYAHWHGMYEVAERFYQQLIPQAREIAHKAEGQGKKAEAKQHQSCERAQKDLEQARSTRASLEQRAATVEQMQKADKEVGRREADTSKACRS